MKLLEFNLIVALVCVCGKSTSSQALPSPTNLQISSVTATSLTLTWDYPAEMAVDGFNISYTFTINECDGSEETANVFLFDSSLRSYTITDSSATPVEEDSRYTIVIIAVNGTSMSESSDTAERTTPTAAPGSPQLIREASSNATNITIQWDRVACQERNGDVDAYRVVYYPTSDSTDSNTEPIAGTSDNNRMFSVTGLPPRTSYTFEVQAVNSGLFVRGTPATLTVSTSAPQNFGFLFDGQLYPNNSVVTVTDIGSTSSGPALFCLTLSTECCGDTETPNEATVTREWYLPDGRQLSSAGTVFTREQVSSAVSLYRNGGTSLSGVFRCDVPDASRNSQSIFIGLYPSTGGSPGRPSITSVLFDRDNTTLTCTSTGGPPTSVTWRKNGVPVNNSLYQQSQGVVDTETATYENLLFNDDISNFVGTFSCEVSNVRGTAQDTVALNGVSIIRDRFTVGGSATALCKSDTLATRIEWLTEGVVVDSATSTQQLDLDFPLINDSIHNQDYTCRVTREGGMTATQNFTVKVDVPSDAVTASVSRSGTARAGMIYSLTCTVSKISGFVNSPTATWTTGGVAVYNGNDITVSSTTNDTSSSSTLTFDPLRTSHEGIYMCLGSLNSPARDEPLITSTPENQRVQISTPDISITVPPGPLYAGRTTPLTLTCTISINSATDTTISVTDMDITWLNGSASLSNSDDRVTISPLSGSQQPFTSNLTLSPLSTFDSTSFTCRAQARPQANVQTLVTASEQREGTVSVTVVSPLPPTVNIVHSISPVMAGQPLTLTCSATVQEGIDVSPTLTWTKDGVEQSSGSVLTFDRLLTSHGGVYTCTARLNIPEAGVDVYRTNTTTIVVQIPPPSITITGSPRNVTFFQSLVLNLTCCAELHSAVDSPVSVEGYWEMNGTRLQNTNSGDERLMVTNNFMESLPYYSIIIRLNPMTFRDAGTYACFANVTPHVSDFISGPELPTSNQRTINIQALPSPAINLFSRQPSSDGCGEAMSLNCTFELVAGFVVPPTTSWVDPNGREVSTDESANPQTDSQLLIFNNITAANTGIYTCQVVIGGNVEASTSIDINNKVLGVPQNLQCSVSSSSSELSFSWELPTVLASEVIDYRVEVKGLRHRDGTREVVQFEVDGFNTEMKETTISEGLDGEVPYNITVRALNLAGCGEVQQIYCFTREGVPPRPEEVKIAISNSTTLSVSWKRFTLVELKGLASYVITYRATSESSAQANNAIISVPWTQNYTVVTGLSPVVEYNIAVSTATMNQMSEPVQMHITTSTTVTTAQDSPGTEMPNTGSGSTIPIIIGVVVAIIVMVTIILVVIVILVIIRMKRRRAEINFEKTRMLRAFNQPVGIMSGTVERYSIDIDAEKEESCKKEGEFLQTSQTVECELVETTAAVPVTFTAAPKTQTSTMESKENELS